MALKMKKQLTILSVILIFSSTAGVMAKQLTKTETISSGWQLILNQDLNIPQQNAGVYLQNGKVKDETEVDLYYPNCRLEVRDPQDKAQTVQADSFTVYRVSWTEDDVLLHSNQYAANGIFHISSPTADDYATTLYLRSEQQPDVTLLTCKHWEDPTSFAQHLSLQQIRNTLGEIFTLQPRDK